jgi:hypothetical protein
MPDWPGRERNPGRNRVHEARSVCCDNNDHEIAQLALYIFGQSGCGNGPPRWTEEMRMTEGLTLEPSARVRGRPFEKGRSGNPGGRRVGCRNKTTIAAAALLTGEAEALTRKAVELALDGDPSAMRLCFERILPSCRDRMVKFALPPIESAADIAGAMKAATAALAGGMITPGEAATIAAELAMPDLDLIKQVEQGVRDRRGQFARGRSG